MKRSHEAVNDCPYCWQEDRRPLVAVISLGIKVYLALPQTIQMVPFHCIIVPTQHVTSTVELEDDAWDEIRNFQKSLLQMMHEQDKGVIFTEQVINFKWHRHTIIECIPVPQSIFLDAPAYFRESLNESESEWSQHKKVIETSHATGGIRSRLTSKLAYFHVWFGIEKGFAHIIEEPKEWEPWFGKVYN